MGSYWRRFLAGKLTGLLPGSKLAAVRAQLWRWADVRCGRRVNLYPGVQIIAGEVQIGDDCYIGPNTLVTGGTIVIESGVDISANVTIHAGTHDIGPSTRRAGAAHFGRVFIGAGSWIGAGATLIDGAVIGRGSVVAAGSLVRGSIPDNCLAAGVPAVVKKNLE